MSLITRCPACGTMFKVVPDQLRISEGWVRCGHCTEVFDASANLQAEASAEPMPPAPQPAVRAGATAADEIEGFGSSLHTEFDDAPVSPGPDTLQLDAQALALVEDPLDRPFELRREDMAQAPDARPTLHVVRADEPPTSRADEAEPEPELHDLAFVRDARRRAFWGLPVVRFAMATALVVLALLLIIQILVHERDRLAAASPALRGLLAGLCAPLNCTIRPPRQIEAISIDSSSFNKLRGEEFRLNLTLRNQAAMDVAMPALELTLTDGQDQPVVRRVLTPAELGAKAAVIGAASEWSGSLALAVANGNGARITGYRLLAFYP